MEEQIFLNENELKLIDLIINYTDQVLFPPFSFDNLWIEEQFIAGDGIKQTNFGVSIGITKIGKKYIDDIITLLRNEFYFFETRRKALEKHILDFFKFNVFNDTFFSGDYLLFSKKDKVKTLLKSTECNDKKYFGYKLMNSLLDYLKKSFSNILTLIPLQNIDSGIEYFEGNGFFIIKSENINRWKNLEKEYSLLRLFDPITATIVKKPSIIYKEFKNHKIWLGYSTFADYDNQSFQIYRYIRVFLCFLISEISKQYFNQMKYLRNNINNFVFIFQKNNIKEAFENDLFPIISNEIRLSDENIYSIFSSLNNIMKLNIEEKNRLFLFCDYVIKSLNKRDEERIINLFIAIDALWGIDGKSKKTNCDGMLSVLDKNLKNDNKVKKLYDLRCNLIHGGCSIIDEWSFYDEYIKDYDDEPENDLLKIIFNKLNKI